MLSALILVPMFLHVPAASAEIFKCVTKNGMALYQNFPCQFDSIGWVPSAPDFAKKTSVTSDAIRQRAKAGRVDAASTASNEPYIGMTSDEVTALLGEPEERIEDEPAKGGRISIWRYADGRSVQFDHEHRVLAVQR